MGLKSRILTKIRRRPPKGLHVQSNGRSKTVYATTLYMERQALRTLQNQNWQSLYNFLPT